MTATTLRTEEIVGLGAAVVLHAGLAAILLLRPEPESLPPPPQTVTVSLATEVGLEAASPTPVLESRAAIAPTISDEPAPPAPAEPAVAAPQPASAPAITRPPPPRNPARITRPVPPAAAQPPRRRPDNPASRPSPPKPAAPVRRAGGSRVGADFLPGAGDSNTTSETRPTAATIGPSELASLDSAVGRQVKVKWQGRVPQGPDAEKLVTRVRFRLNPDGSLAGEPVVVGNTTGVTDLNRNQVGRHQEEAIRAVKLAARFNLPFEVPASSNTFTLKFDRN